MTGLPILSLIVFSPLVAALVVQLLPAEPVRVPRVAAFVLALVPFVLALVMLAEFDPSVGTLQLRERVPWIPPLGVDYAMGVDGFSLWLILLTTFLTPVVVLAAWTDITERVRLFMVFMLALESAMLGALCATPAALLLLLGVHADPDGVRHLALGPRTARVRGHQVHHLHARRQRLHARRRHLPLAAPRAGHGGAQLRHHHPLRHAPH